MVVINIPYNPLNFTAKTEVNLFLERLLEVFSVLFIGALLIAYLLTRYITKSIEEVRKKIEGVEINEANEKLIWEKQDEIGVLVNAYNKMIDKLEVSKKKLAKNERQTAWSEMAKQIAHEIKNPLTPMKLSVQHLRRVMSLKGKDEEHLKQFEDKMIGQINLLTEIADEFSNFAELPKAKMKSINLSVIISNTISLYNHHKHVKIIHDKLNDIVIFGDENQLTRVFNNLLKNSIQAVNSKGEISISTKVNSIHNVILVEDNGKGIPIEIEDKIFEPKFTTKTSGKGLGLPIVAQIIRNHGGEISLMKKNQKAPALELLYPFSKMSQKIEGFFLRSTKLKQNVLLVDLYTFQYGRSSFIFSHQKKSPFIFQPFHFFSFQSNYNPEKKLNRANNQELIFPVINIVSDVRKTGLAILLTEILNKCIHNFEVSPSLYIHIKKMIISFEHHDFNPVFGVFFVKRYFIFLE